MAEQLDLLVQVREAIGAAYEQWDGRGWPELKADAVPIAARIAQLAEFMEVAHRVGGVDAATALARRAGRQAVRSGARRAAVREGSRGTRRS